MATSSTLADPIEQAEQATAPAPNTTNIPDESSAPASVPHEAATSTAEQIEDDEIKSKRVTLADLCAKGTALYAHKNYEEAAQTFAEAAELQAEINGEMSTQNAEILFLYGRSLFKVGQSKSDVLGGKSTGEKGETGGGASSKPTNASSKASVDKEAQKKAEEIVDAKKPLFQFSGDENFDGSDNEDAGNEDADEEEEEEEDDLAVAFEILDLGRVLLEKRLEEVESSEQEGDGKGKNKFEGDSSSVRHVKERLADTHDLLGEISLENERYPNAIIDSRASLKYKKDLYPQESEIIAEAHFKLSLALEFASITSTEEGGEETETKALDQEMRDEAVRELEAAIESTKLKLQSKEVELATSASPEDNDVTRKQIAEVKEVIADMEQRLEDLRGPPIDLNEAVYGASGLLGSSSAKTEEAKKPATDLNSLVRKKAKTETPAAAPNGSNGATNGESNGKRKAEDAADETAEDAHPKKVRVEEPAELPKAA